ncbi:hypothetical protein A2cp1_3698 [Anaeromyxobacter dehalogenans 2CP-1]|uniref:Uncharacterized protein n=2 Tax=Anaeromyxobacter dehalogenans TaxID=161493 RepID=B8J6Q2_ANAD2|nr:hypothetical protein A2cp1_3698 [Anaeromyxobacter dehalogenans 2CP-1]
MPPKLPNAPSPGVFRPKSAEDYRAQIQGGFQVRSRKHEALVRIAGELLLRKATVTTPHPVDLRMTSPVPVIFEAKTVGSRGPGAAIREAVGQLYEYRYFIGPRDARLCVLLDDDPGAVLVQYVEDELGLMIAWLADGVLRAGPVTSDSLRSAGIDLAQLAA